MEQEDEIKQWTEEIKEWNYPRSDFFQFVTVLNRFDEILESICKEYGMKQHIQNNCFDNATKQTLLSILNFTRLLFDNCSNRNLYNSYEVMRKMKKKKIRDLLINSTLFIASQLSIIYNRYRRLGSDACLITETSSAHE